MISPFMWIFQGDFGCFGFQWTIDHPGGEAARLEPKPLPKRAADGWWMAELRCHEPTFFLGILPLRQLAADVPQSNRKDVPARR